jgi:hypothetical protein
VFTSLDWEKLTEQAEHKAAQLVARLREMGIDPDTIN